MEVEAAASLALERVLIVGKTRQSDRILKFTGRGWVENGFTTPTVADSA